jgi:hypothetical protein
MQITKNSVETTIGPSDWFTRAIYIDAVAAPPAPNRAQANLVHFTPGAHRLAHPPARADDLRHRGIGLCQREGGAIEVIALATECSSSPARTTGTAPPQTALWSTSRSKRPTTPEAPPPRANTSPTRNTRPLRCCNRRPTARDARIASKSGSDAQPNFANRRRVEPPRMRIDRVVSARREPSRS